MRAEQHSLLAVLLSFLVFIMHLYPRAVARKGLRYCLTGGDRLKTPVISCAIKRDCRNHTNFLLAVGTFIRL